MARLRTILGIDDQRNALIGRKMLLEKSSHDPLESTGGEKGLKLFGSQLPNSQSRPHFSKWLDHWKNRIQAVKL
jgi:hypothetical protein